MSNECKHLIVHLLNRNKSRRLGANGAKEIKSHPFFKGIEWKAVYKKQLPVTKSKNTIAKFKLQYKNVKCTEAQRNKIFEDTENNIA
jgi:hypothetical protein